MTAKYGHRLGKFVGLDEPPTLSVRTLQYAEITATRLRWQYPASGVPTRLERNNGYLLCFQRRHLPPGPYWIDGRATTLQAVQPGQFLMLDLNEEHSSLVHDEVDCISMYTPKSALDRFEEEHELRPIGALRTPRAMALEDGVIRNLAESLLPAFDGAGAASQMFIDHVSLALLSHLASHYAERPASLVHLRGRLAPWQERRAKEMLLANIDGRVGLEDLARACSLSRAHFARSFKATTGSTPMQWLLTQRIERAQNLLLNSSLPIEEIAHHCGFSDQSHLTRAFAAAVGDTPGSWRRRRRF